MNKPFNVLSQFTDANDRATLADYVEVAGVYPAGRLDRDSEGLLLLTDDGQWQARISSPKFKMLKTYFAQVEGVIDEPALEQLRKGVHLKDGLTRPAQAQQSQEPKWLWPRTPPIRERKNIPTSWLKLQISEGRNRQVRRMTAAVGYPTLRLIRWSIGDWDVSSLAPGQWLEQELTPLHRSPAQSPTKQQAKSPARPKHARPASSSRRQPRRPRQHTKTRRD